MLVQIGYIIADQERGDISFLGIPLYLMVKSWVGELHQ